MGDLVDETSIFYQTKLFKYHSLTNISSHNYITSKADPLQASYYFISPLISLLVSFTIDLKTTKFYFTSLFLLLSSFFTSESRIIKSNKDT
ncbi:unnamed protein product [Brassica oleracea]